MTESQEFSDGEEVRARVHEYEEKAAAEVEGRQTRVVLEDVVK